MEWSLVFVLNSILLGVGLAMDAFSVSLANGLHEPDMRRGRICVIAGVFAFFQFLIEKLVVKGNLNLLIERKKPFIGG